MKFLLLLSVKIYVHVCEVGCVNANGAHPGERGHSDLMDPIWMKMIL